MNKFLDAKKALEAILYVSKSTNNLFNIVKTLYYADKFHLQEYGRVITGDCYIAMEDGPVPSGAYHLIKFARGDAYLYDKNIFEAHPEKAIKVARDGKNTWIYPQREPDFNHLSESDLECLDEAIKKYANMDPGELWKLVHKEKSYNETKRDEPIPLREIIALDIPNGKDVLAYLDS